MDKQATGVVAYITWIGWIIAYVAGDREGAKFHLNQALVLQIFGFLSFVPYLGTLWSIFIFICSIIGFVAAINGEENEVPLLGSIRIIK